VGRLYIHEMAGYRVSPAVNGASAREHERVHTVFVQNGQFQAMKEGGIEYGLPHCKTMCSVASVGFDFTQILKRPTAADADNVTLSLREH